MAGLLTLSIPDAFPLHLIFTRICSGAGYRNFYRRLQQRVLSRIYTWFPIIRNYDDNSGTITSTNIGKTLAFRETFFINLLFTLRLLAC